jgi:hypothetical protein
MSFPFAVIDPVDYASLAGGMCADAVSLRLVFPEPA